MCPSMSPFFNALSLAVNRGAPMVAERPSDKLVVWAQKGEGRRIGVAYATIEEAHMAAASLEKSGYRIIQIARKATGEPLGTR